MSRLQVIFSPPPYRARALRGQELNSPTITTLLITHSRFGWPWDFPPIDATDHAPTDRALAQDFRDMMLLPSAALQLFWISDQVERSEGAAFAACWQGVDANAYRAVLRSWWLRINADNSQ